MKYAKTLAQYLSMAIRSGSSKYSVLAARTLLNWDRVSEDPPLHHLWIKSITANRASPIVMKRVNFHQHAFTSKPFLSIDFNHDWLEQVLPPGTVLMQPRLGNSPHS